MTSTPIRQFDDSALDDAVGCILAGQPVAVPTETVYGLAADATNGAAVARIYEIKGRPSFNPLIVHVPDLESADRIGVMDADALALAEEHWPGPLTIVVAHRPGSGLSSLVTAGLPTIALRMPAHPVIQSVLRACGRPLAAPSANRSGSISPTRAEHVVKSLSGKVALVIDGGACERGIESTIVATGNGQRRLLRPGPIDLGLPLVASGSIEAPGQLASHYAPSKPLRLDALSAAENEFLIGFGPVAGHVNLSQTGDLIEAAARLFDLLHQADASSLDSIAIAPVPRGGLGAAINDRLARAAA